MEYAEELDLLNNRVVSQQGVLNKAIKDKEASIKLLEEYNSKRTLTKEAILLCNLCMDKQSEVKVFIEKLQTAILQACLGPNYSFVLDTVEKNGTIVGLEPFVIEDGVKRKPGNTFGGMQNIIGIGFHLCINLLTKGTQPVMFCDELLANSNTVLFNRFLTIIKEIQTKIPFQFIAITHSDADFDHTIRISKPAKVSKVVEELLNVPV